MSANGDAAAESDVVRQIRSPDGKFYFVETEDGSMISVDGLHLVRGEDDRLQIFRNSHKGFVLMTDKLFDWEALFKRLPKMERTWCTLKRLGAMKYSQLIAQGVIQDGRFVHHEALAQRAKELKDEDQLAELDREIDERAEALECEVRRLQQEAQELTSLRLVRQERRAQFEATRRKS